MTDHNETPVSPSGEQTPNYSATPADTAPNAAPVAHNSYAAPSAPAGQDPSKTLSIVGLVLAILVPPAGLVVSIIAKLKARKAGVKNGFSTAGIIISIVLVVLEIVVIVALVAFVSNIAADVCAGYAAGVYQTPDGKTVTCG